MARNKKGDRRERELVNLVDATPTFVVMRAPASGSATERELPDLLAGNGDNFYAVEAKSSSGDPIYLTGEEVEALYTFANAFGATAKIGVRFDDKPGDPSYGNDDHTGWYFFDPETLHITDGGNYRVKKETALADGTRFRDIFGEPQPEEDSEDED